DEIEQVLLAHPGIERAVVMPPAPGDAAQRLTAYVQTRRGADLDLETATRFLRGRLPAHTIPTAIVPRHVLPLTANGKIDTAAWTGGRAVSAKPRAEGLPRDAIELEIKLIWQDLLGIDEIGIDDNFFEIGGHSLLATQLVARVNRRFAQEIP